MPKFLIPCADCARHVQSSDAECPFCGAALSSANTVPKASPPRGVSRAAAIAFGATLVVACSGGTDPTPGGDGGADSNTSSTSSTSSAYGGPPIDAGLDDDGSADASDGARASDSGQPESGGGS